MDTTIFTAIAYRFMNSQAYLYWGTGYFCYDELHRNDHGMGCLHKDR